MKAFAQLPANTQKAIVGALVIVLLGAGAFVSWSMHERRAAAQRHLEASLANRQAMTELVQRFDAQRTSGAAVVDLSALVTRSLQGKGFQPSQVQQQNGELALRIDAASFNEIVTWMAELAEAGVAFSNVGIAQAPAGTVNLTVVLRDGQPPLSE